MDTTRPTRFTFVKERTDKPLKCLSTPRKRRQVELALLRCVNEALENSDQMHNDAVDKLIEQSKERPSVLG